MPITGRWYVINVSFHDMYGDYICSYRFAGKRTNGDDVTIRLFVPHENNNQYIENVSRDSGYVWESDTITDPASYYYVDDIVSNPTSFKIPRLTQLST